MAEKINVISLDWRKYGDFSAVGQLTKKIFSIAKGVNVSPVECIDRKYCNLYELGDDGQLNRVFNAKVMHDAAQSYIKNSEVDVFYIRLSPHIGLLELACKIVAVQSNIPLIVHYMDKPSFIGMPPRRAAYIKNMYNFLTLRANSVYTIHSSSVSSLFEMYGCKARVLANFIKGVSKPEFEFRKWQERPIQISYFGSVDPSMNASALTVFCRLISKCSWIKLSIWTNSHPVNLHELNGISEGCRNIEVFASNLDHDSYELKLKESDLLLIAYNLESEEHLKHSFSNKFVDYLEVGGLILCFGPKDIPVVGACRETGSPLVFETEAELARAFESKEMFLSLLLDLDIEEYVDKIYKLRIEQTTALDSFIDDVKRLSELRRGDRYKEKKYGGEWTGNAMETQQLAFLIRRKFYDLATGQHQSLSATLMAETIKNRGYLGFDYEI